MILKTFVKLHYYMLVRNVLGTYSNYLVYLHTKATPTREDIEREILLEKLRFRQRRVEQTRWNYWIKIKELAGPLGVDELEIEKLNTLLALETEDVLAKEYCGGRTESLDDNESVIMRVTNNPNHTKEAQAKFHKYDISSSYPFDRKPSSDDDSAN